MGPCFTCAKCFWWTVFAGPGGYGSRSTAEQATRHSSSPLTAMITGATSGIGAETERVLAKRGVKRVIAARDKEKASEMRRAIQKETPNAEIIISDIDLSSLASVKTFSSHFLYLGLPLNILILNDAGMFSKYLEPSERQKLRGHLPQIIWRMIETAAKTGIEGRILNVSSVVHCWIKTHSFSFANMLKPKSYNGTRAYARSKLANILHAKEIARQLKARNARVTINALHPGIVKTAISRAHQGFITDSVFFMAAKLLKTTAEGAATSCYVALSKQTEGRSGKYLADCNETNCSTLANTESEAHQLWTQTHALIHTHLHLHHLNCPSVFLYFLCT